MTTPPEIETQMREAAIYCGGPAVPWMTARDIAERAVLAAEERRTREIVAALREYRDSAQAARSYEEAKILRDAADNLTARFLSGSEGSEG